MNTPCVPVRRLQLPRTSISVQNDVGEQNCSGAVGLDRVAETLQYK